MCMCVVVNLDLVVPAVIASEFLMMRCLAGYEDNKDSYLEALTISTRQIMNYAVRMKSWDLGRVVVNFDSQDADRYLQSRPDIFRQIDRNHIYSIRLSEHTDKDKALLVSELIDSLTSTINYSKSVLRTVGLLYDTKIPE